MQSSAVDGYPGRCNLAAGEGKLAILLALRCPSPTVEIGIFGPEIKMCERLCAVKMAPSGGCGKADIFIKKNGNIEILIFLDRYYFGLFF